MKFRTFWLTISLRARGRHWHAADAQWALIWFGLTATLVAATATALWTRQVAREARRVSVETASAIGKLAAMAATTSASSAPPATDFAAHLPASIEIQSVLSQIQRRCAEAEVTFVGVQIQPRIAQSEQLARTDLTVSLRGSYPKLKRVLAEVLDRFPNATLAHLTWRRSTGATDVEATVALALWGGATAAAAATPGPGAR